MDQWQSADLLDRRYGARHVEGVTGGAVTGGLLRQWLAQKRLIRLADDIKAPAKSRGGRGKAHKLHLMQVYQLALLNEIKQRGVPLDRATRWAGQIMGRFIKGDPAPQQFLLFSRADEQPDNLPAQALTAEMEARRSSGQAFAVIDIAALIAKTKEILRDMNARDDKAAAAARRDEARP